jgi:predicted nucleotidyltransferase
MTPEEFADSLRRALPEALKSVVVYGSAAAGDFVPGVSRYDVLLVADPLGAAELNALASPVKEWVGRGNPLPQLFSPAEIASSVDAFPIEFLDMQQSRKVVWGADPLATVAIDLSRLRWQVERELKGKLLLLREKSLLARGDAEALLRLLVQSASTFLVLMRAALRLYQQSAPATKREDLDALARHIPFDPQPFRSVLELKEGTLRPGDVDPPSLFESYLTSVERIVRAVDQQIHLTSSKETTS